MLGQVREHMEVLGSDDQPCRHRRPRRRRPDHPDQVRPEAGGVHHSLPCTWIEPGRGDKVILDRTAEQAKMRWRDESRDRALFEREDQGEAGPHILDRSFSGTYR